MSRAKSLSDPGGRPDVVPTHVVIVLVRDSRAKILLGGFMFTSMEFENGVLEGCLSGQDDAPEGGGAPANGAVGGGPIGGQGGTITFMGGI